MKQLEFKHKNKSLRVYRLEKKWWFALEDLALLLNLSSPTSFIANRKIKHCDEINEVAVCDLQEFCRSLYRCSKPIDNGFPDWFFDEVLPKLKEFEIEDPLSPITKRLEKLESDLATWMDLGNCYIADLSDEIKKGFASIKQAPPEPSKTTLAINQLREQKEYNAQIIENFIRSIEEAESTPVETDIDSLFLEKNNNGHLVVNRSNGNGNGHG